MSVYVRRFLQDPGDAVLLNIESVNILDLTPPASIQGVGSGTVLVVGEFENGPFLTPQQVMGTTDLSRTWGTLGYSYGGLQAQYPSAPVRKADNTLTPEYWNGNAFVQMSGLQFSTLIFCRVNTSVGSVTFSPLAFVEGAVEFSYQLTSGQVLELALSPHSTTLAAAVTLPVATVSVASTAGFSNSGSFTVGGQVVAYTGISGNTFTGCTGGAGTVPLGTIVVGAAPTAATFTGVAATVTGTGAAFASITSGMTAVLAYDGLPNFTVTFQTGDTTIAAVISRINAAAGFTFASNNAGQLELTGRIPGTSGSVQVVSGTALTDLGLTAALTPGTGNVGNINQILFTEIQTVVQGAISGSKVELNSSGALRVSNTTTPATGAIAVAASTTALGLGFTAGEADVANVGPGGTLPAGTVVQDTGAATILVTMQDLVIPANSSGPFSVPVRFANDNGTGTGVGPGTITVVANPPDIGAFAVTNPASISNALTEAQIDAAYTAAIQATTSTNSVSRVANIIVSARQSNTVRSQLKQNALFASANGSFGRMACLGPPLNTPETVALGNVAPGVVATRDQRVIYCYIGVNTYVPLIGAVGLAGGTGFTASGNVDVHSDMLMASILSQLPPEENPGQETTFTANVNGIETGSNVQNFNISDYIAFKAAGIAAVRIDQNGVAIFQSGVTSVDPNVYPQLVRIARRRMADFIEDSIAGPTTAYGKKLSLQARRKALKGEIRGFLAGLLSKNNPGSQRIAGYTVSDSDGNDDTTLSSGMYRITADVKTLPSLDSIVIQATIGDDVTVQEVLPVSA